MSLFGGNSSVSSTPPQINSVKFQTSTYGMCIPVVFGTTRITGNLIWFGDFNYISPPPADTGKGGGAGDGGGGGSINYFASYAYGLCEGPIAGVSQVWVGSNIKPTANKAGFAIYTGLTPQTPWTHLSSLHPEQALAYSGLAYAAKVNGSLGSGANLPNVGYEVQGMNILPGLKDANPADVVTGIVTNTKWGLGQSLSLIDVADWWSYCMAQDLLISPAFTSRQTVEQILSDLAEMTNTEMVWHDGSVLRFVPCGDAIVTANGVTWTPNLAPVYDLTDDDFISDGSDDPVTVIRKSPADCYNSLKVEYYDRDQYYNVVTRTLFDQAAIDLYGARPGDTMQWHSYAEAGRAIASARILLQKKAYLKNTYQFRLGWRHCRLEPMDIVSLTDSSLGMTKYPVRITKVDEDEEGLLSLEAEDLMQGVGSVNPYETTIWQAPMGYTDEKHVMPGDVVSPVFFPAPGPYVCNGYKELWIAVSGNDSYWAGCVAYYSLDGLTYKKYLAQYGQSTYGFLLSDLPSTADPDTTNSFDVAQTGLNPPDITSLSQETADANLNLMLVDDELIAFTTATLTDVNRYTFGDYLRRGQQATTIAAHNPGAPFFIIGSPGVVYFFNGFIRYLYGPAQSGKTIYWKLCSFNKYKIQQDIAEVTPYTIVLP